MNWEIYGNVFVHTDTPCSNKTGPCHLSSYDTADAISVIKDDTNSMIATNWKIYNNAFVNYRGRASISFSTGSTNVYVYNNLWWCNFTSAYANYVYISGPITYDYNYYTKCVFPYSFNAGAHEPPTQDMPEFRQTKVNIDVLNNWKLKDYT